MKCLIFSIAFVVLLQTLVCCAGSITNTSNCVSSKAKKVFCYVSAKAENYTGAAKLTLNKIDVTLCDVVAYFESSRMQLNNDLLPAYDNDEIRKLTASRITKLKEKRHGFKVLLETNFVVDSDLIKQINAKNMSFEKYAKSLAEHIKYYNFDGMVFAFGNPDLDKETFVAFFKACSDAFTELNLIRIVYADLPNFIIAHIFDYFDYLQTNSGTYFYTTESLRLYAPLAPRPDEPDVQQLRNIEWLVNFYKNMGLPKSKILLTINIDSATYKIYKGKNKLGSPFIGPGLTGPLTNRENHPTYFELCTLIKEDGWKIKYNKLQQGPYAYNSTDWITYENFQSVKAKAKLINDHGIGGVWISSLQLDDHSGQFCCEGKYPLTKAILKALNDD